VQLRRARAHRWIPQPAGTRSTHSLRVRAVLTACGYAQYSQPAGTRSTHSAAVPRGLTAWPTTSKLPHIRLSIRRAPVVVQREMRRDDQPRHLLPAQRRGRSGEVLLEPRELRFVDPYWQCSRCNAADAMQCVTYSGHGRCRARQVSVDGPSAAESQRIRTGHICTGTTVRLGLGGWSTATGAPHYTGTGPAFRSIAAMCTRPMSTLKYADVPATQSNPIRPITLRVHAEPRRAGPSHAELRRATPSRAEPT
jgi:hypothetical protein